MPLKKQNSLEPWEKILSKSILKPGDLPLSIKMDKPDITEVISEYPMLINPYYMGLIKTKNDPIYRQAVPDIREIYDSKGLTDPLDEEGLSPVPGLTHKYPGRVLFLVSGRCAMYCRFCNRKRKTGKPFMVTKESIKEGLSYIRNTRDIYDVLLSGGDPLLLSDNELFEILSRLRSFSHVKIIRIGTRVPCTLPHRITPRLTEILKGFHPIYINTHFNHPSEVTPTAGIACSMLADAGIPLGCQTVLLKGVNDNVEVMKELMLKLLAVRVKPYYLFQADLAKGTSHFWTPLEKGLEIISELQGYISGLAVPRFMIDLPYGGGKVPVIPKYIRKIKGKNLVIKNYLGNEYSYPVIDQGL